MTMTARACMDQVLHGQKPERLPCIEWATWWDLTLDRWHTEGLDPKLTGKALKHHFGLDFDRQFWIGQDFSKMPKFKEFGYITDEDDYDKVLPYLYQKQPIYDLFPILDKAHEEYEEKGDITWMSLDGFFWFPRTLMGIEDHLYSFYDYPELYHRICEDLTEYHLFVIDQVTQHFHPQFMTIAEDMSYNLGPMLSEDLFNEFLKPYYDRLIPALKRNGIKVLVDSDGDVTKMLPWLINAGVEGILPLERQAGVDVDVLTQQYPDFLFVGGYNKLIMKDGEEAMIQEFERILPAMRRGNYIPSVDHQTPPEVPIENYRIYTKLLRHYCDLAVR